MAWFSQFSQYAFVKPNTLFTLKPQGFFVNTQASILRVFAQIKEFNGQEKLKHR